MAPPKTWPEVFAAAKKLKAAGYATCGFSNAWVTWVNVEQLGAWHNVALSTKSNGLDGFDTVLSFNGPLHVRHLQNLVDLQKDKTYDYSGRTNTGEGRFTSGECPIFLTSSAFFGNVHANAKFDFAAAPMPYYPDIPNAPQNSIIGGASLWVMGGKKPDEYKGVAKFFTFLSDTDRQVAVHKASGYLPDHQGRLRQDQGRPATTRTHRISRYRSSSSPTRSRPRIRAGCGSATWCSCATSGPRSSNPRSPARRPPRKRSTPPSLAATRCCGSSSARLRAERLA